MLYQFLLDDVARKPPGSKGQPDKVDSTESRGPTTQERGLVRTQSTPRRAQAFQYPLQEVKGETWEDEDVAARPRFPAPPARVLSTHTEYRDSKRLTM